MMKSISIIQFNKKYKSYFIWFFSIIILAASCKKDLDVKDPNDPTFGTNVNNESGLAAYCLGAIYWNGFKTGDGWLGDSYFSLPWGYHELMGDVIGGGQGSNNQVTTMGVPDYFIADPSNPSTTTVTNASPQVSIIRSYNNSSATANSNNALYYEWLNMYSIINSCNLIFENLGGVANLSTDKANTVKAWAYWWKGWAYAQIGTLYYSGLVEDKSNTVVTHYLKQDSIIAESNKQLNLALTTLGAISSSDDYSTMISELIPSQCKAGLGMPMSITQFKRTINTMLARNILLNKLAPFVNGSTSATISKSTISPITATDWQSIITYCTSGIQNGDNVITGRTASSNSFFSTTGGSVAALCSISNQNSTFKVSERLVQQFGAGDNRLGNFTTANGTFYGDGNTNSTRYTLLDWYTNGLSGFQTLGSRTVGELEIYIGPTYEENALMLAEAYIRTGQTETGLGYIDAVRTYQGAGVAAVKGTGLTQTQALAVLSQERLAALAFRGLSFYDLRRWGWIYSIANGGGRYGCNLIYNKTLYTNATISYNYMDYWDVPGDETEKNPGDGSTATKNPNY